MILHLDMDAFFASVEQMDNPALRGQPVIIGGRERGVVATASYEARRFGIHSAMPMATARRLCPHGHFLPGRIGRYAQLSRAIMARLRDFSPMVQPASIDEAYLDISGMGRLYATPHDLAAAIKRAVLEQTGGLTCSIGIAAVKFLAKICSDMNKPDGIYILKPCDMDAFLGALPVGKLPGVGKAMQASLNSYGVFSVSQLRCLSLRFLLERYGKCGQLLYDRARAIDPRTVHANPPPKSESTERTLARDVLDRAYLARELLAHAEKVGAALRKNSLAGHTITIKIKFSDFSQITRSRTIAFQTSATRTIYGIAADLLMTAPLDMPVRLIGLSVSGFESKSGQYLLPGLLAQLEGTGSQRQMLMDKAMDEIRGKFGKRIIQRAASMENGMRASSAHHFG